MLQPKTILFAPLDWGLGHATRCIPLIQHLLDQNQLVVIASEGNIGVLLKNEFPQVQHISLRGYRIQYSRHPRLFVFKLLLQSVRVTFTITHEHFWLKKVVKKFGIDAVVSDNRLGLFHSKIPSIYITHQLSIQTNRPLLTQWINRIHLAFIRRYNECWVPDAEEKGGLGGKLSHPPAPISNVMYLGPISRLHVQGKSETSTLLLLLSGPEPQRTLFENQLMKQLLTTEWEVVLVRGLPSAVETPIDIQHWMQQRRAATQVFSHLNGEDLSVQLEKARWVICRSGYTSVMDLAKLRAKAILVPTPGQTEQGYLAQYLRNQNYFFSTDQEGFLLDKALQEASVFQQQLPQLNWESHQAVLDRFVQTLYPTDL